MTTYGDPTPIRSALRRVTPRRGLFRAGLSEDPGVPLPTDTPEVAAVLTDEGFASALAGVARELRRDPRDVRAEAAGYLRNKPVAGAADLTDRATVHRALEDLVRSGVLTDRTHRELLRHAEELLGGLSP